MKSLMADLFQALVDRLAERNRTQLDITSNGEKAWRSAGLHHGALLGAHAEGPGRRPALQRYWQDAPGPKDNG